MLYPCALYALVNKHKHLALQQKCLKLCNETFFPYKMTALIVGFFHLKNLDYIYINLTHDYTAEI